MAQVLGILGYTDRFSYRPGETVTPCFSLEDGSASYSLQVVRITSGDDGTSDEGYGWEPISAIPTRRLQGRRQPIPAGSYVCIDNAPAIDFSSGLILSLRIFPTLPVKGRRQSLLSRRGDGLEFSFGLGLNEAGAPELWIERGLERLAVVGQTLRPNRWYAIVAAIDSKNGVIALRQDPIGRTFEFDHGALSTQKLRTALPNLPVGRLLIGAAEGPVAQNAPVIWHFEGKIEAPALYEGDQTAVMTASGPPSHLPMICGWDFSLGIDTAQVHAIGTPAANGRCVNHPTRGVAGAAWDGAATDWRRRPEHYAAIHFHGDDLEDCRWSSDCEVKLPPELASGIYALRAETDNGSRDTVPFFVVPAKAGGAGRLAFLASTFTYLAYANSHHGYEDPLSEPAYGAALVLTPTDVFLNRRRDLGTSLYDRHLDGSGACLSSFRRPVLNMRPDGKLWNFAADLHVIGWLEHLDIAYDVISDDVLNAEGVSVLQPYACLVTSTHPEYFTRTMLDAMRGFLAQGGRLFYTGGNGFYWKVATSPHFPHSIEVRRGEAGTRCHELPAGERHHQFDGEFGGLWRANGAPPHALVGIGFVAEGFDIGSYYVRTRQSLDPRAKFIFQGVGEDERIGDFGMLGGAAGLELDATDPAQGTPAHALVLAKSVGHSNVYVVTPETMISTHLYVDAISNALARAEMTFFETPSGGAVFSTGSIAWAASLGYNAFRNNVARISENVVQRFLDSAAFTLDRPAG